MMPLEKGRTYYFKGIWSDTWLQKMYKEMTGPGIRCSGVAQVHWQGVIVLLGWKGLLLRVLGCWLSEGIPPR